MSPGSTSSRRSSALVGAGILLSRLAGLARERVIASTLGVGVAVDAFRAALRIPNLLQNLLGEGVLSASFIPVYARLLDEGRDEEAGRVAGAVAGLLATVAGALVVVGVLAARPLTALLAPGFTGARQELTVTLVRILTPGIGFLVLSAWCLGVLNSHRRFFLSYVAPVLWNAAQIAVVVALALRGGDQSTLAEGLAWGALVGGALQFAVQVPRVRSLARPLRLSLRTDLPGVRLVVRRFGPAVAGRGAIQLSAYVDVVMASLLAVGAVSTLGYALVLYLLPISLFGMSVAAAELPELSRLGGPDALSLDGYRTRLDESQSRVAFFVAGVSVAYLVLGDLVVGALLQTGRFGAGETRLVWYTLAAFTLGLLATTSSRLLQNTLYALGDTRTPAVVAALRVAFMAVLGWVLMFQLDRVVLAGPGLAGLEATGLPAPLGPLPVAVRTDPDAALRLGAAGLALASSAAAWLELVLLRRRTRRALSVSGTASPIGRLAVGGGHLRGIVIAALLAGGVGAMGRSLLGDLHPALGLALAGAPAGAAYVVAAAAFGVPEGRALVAASHRLRRRP